MRIIGGGAILRRGDRGRRAGGRNAKDAVADTFIGIDIQRVDGPQPVFGIRAGYIGSCNRSGAGGRREIKGFKHIPRRPCRAVCGGSPGKHVALDGTGAAGRSAPGQGNGSCSVDRGRSGKASRRLGRGILPHGIRGYLPAGIIAGPGRAARPHLKAPVIPARGGR